MWHDLRYQVLKRDIQGLEQKLTDRAEANQRITNEALHHHEVLLENITDSFEKRLKELNGIKETFREHTLTSMPRSEAQTKFDALAKETLAKTETLQAEQRASLKPVNERLDRVGRPNWALWGSGVTLLLSLVAAGWFLINLEITVVSSPLQLATEQLKIADQARDRRIAEISNDTNKNTQMILSLTQGEAASSVDRQQLNTRLRIVEQYSAGSQQADAQSKQDREQLNHHVAQLDSDMANGMADRKANESATKQKLVEVETQMKNAGNIVSMLTDHTEQFLKILWEKTFPGETFGGTHFRPSFHKYSNDNQD